jgi:hypothetical protein
MGKRKSKVSVSEGVKLIGIFGVIALVIASILLGTSSTIVYKGIERPIEDVEEMIEDLLESENPGLDLDVSISVGTEDE